MEKLKQYADNHRKRILDALDYFWKNPETGYREVKTAAYLQREFEALGYKVTTAGNIPGFYADVDTGMPGPTVAVMGELDALEGLWGKIRLMAVPAEELIELQYRRELKKQGIIRYFGGKVELMYRGWFRDVDMCFMLHTANLPADSGYIVGGGNGCMVKEMEFQGVTAHAGATPHMGVNALYAANLAMNAVNALRETFRDEDHIRFHPILTCGGDSVNAIPDKACMESYVRGASMEAMLEANGKINRAMAASAAAMGANVRLQDMLGYHPFRNCTELLPIMKQAMEAVLEQVIWEPLTIRGGCSDVGDLSGVMPMIHPYISGASGKSHGNDYDISDPETACVGSAKVQLCFLKLLLENGAALANRVIKNFVPAYPSQEEYFRFMDSLNLDRQAVVYEPDGTIVLNI